MEKNNSKSLKWFLRLKDCLSIRQLVVFFMFINVWIFAETALTQGTDSRVDNPAVGRLILPSGKINFTGESAELKTFKEQLIKHGIVDLSGKIPQPQKLKKLKQQISDGGVSDGGGNFVGDLLFDFYENKNTFVVPAKYILAWNQNVKDIINKANTLIPKVGKYGVRGFGDELVLAIKSKKWILDAKEITNESCRNESMVQSRFQTIVGCQNFYEVRIWIPGFLFQIEENPQCSQKLQKKNLHCPQWSDGSQELQNKKEESLITHEAILAWVREIDQGTAKSEVEFKVREVHRLLHSELTSEEIVTEMQKLFPKILFYNANEGFFEKMLPAESLKIKQNFCMSRSTEDHARVLSFYKDYPKSYENIDRELKDYLEVLQIMSLIQTKNNLQESIEGDSARLDIKIEYYCGTEENLDVPDLSQTEYKSNFLSVRCKQEIEKTVQRFISIRQKTQAQVFSEPESKSLIQMTMTLSRSAALLCSGLKGIELQRTTFWPFMTESRGQALMRETELQALKYFQLLTEDYNKQNP